MRHVVGFDGAVASITPSLGIKQVVQLHPAGAHALGHFCPGQVLFPHCLLNLPRHHFLDGGAGRLLIHALLFQPVLEPAPI